MAIDYKQVRTESPVKRVMAATAALSMVLSVGLPAGGKTTTNTNLTGSAGSAGVARKGPQLSASVEKQAFSGTGSGMLTAMLSTGKELGQCPLKHTDVKAQVSGYVSRVTVKQTFTNPFKDKIEAVYTFPLSESGAVDSMTMRIGTRVIKGSIKEREKAREIYERAKSAGHVASLLDQERPNIFTQSVANIEPGKDVEITIEYVDLLSYEDGRYSFAFPTVVGPRFNPGEPTGKSGTGWSQDTTQVPDASKITPPIAEEGTRAGHDISISVSIDGGVPFSEVDSKLHEVTIQRNGATKATVSLVNQKTIPNKDFVLSWLVAGDKLKSGYLTYRDPKSKDSSGYFTLMLVPPKKVTPDKVAPKEMVFLIDCSGSQSGRPLEKAKETLTYIVDHMNPQDTFQVISFNNQAELLFQKPMASTPAMRAKAKSYINSLQARGGTWMAPAVEEACKIPADKNRLRIVTFMTDGYVGNDMQIIGMIKKLRKTSRWFPFGTGNSVNRFLIEGMAREGGGESEFVLLNSEKGEVGRKFYKRIASPVLTDVEVAVDGVPVKEVFPRQVADVWAQKPLYFKGRYLKPGAGTVTLTGFQQGLPYKQTLKVNFPESAPLNEGVASMWARAKVDMLMSQDYIAAQRGMFNAELKDEIVKTALAHHIMTQFTSFVAVDESEVTKGGEARKVTVPVEMPDGVSREGVFGKSNGRVFLPAMGAQADPSGALYTMQQRRLAHKSLASSPFSGGVGGPAPAPAPARFNLAPNVYGRATGGSGAATAPTRFGHSPSVPRPTGGGGGEGRAVSPSQKNRVQFYSHNRGMQILDDRPLVKDSRAKEELAETKSDDAKKKQTLSKLSPSLKKLLRSIEESGAAMKDGTRFGVTVVDGKVEVLVRAKMAGKSIDAKLLKALQDAGFELSSQTTNAGNAIIYGKIKLTDLSKLSSVPTVIEIAPHRSPSKKS